MYKLIYVFLLASSICNQSVFSQKPPFKVGKISKEQFELKECSFYPEAKSMILSEYGDLNFRYENDNGWKYQMDVAVRKKIFKITDADQGNIKIQLYEPLKGSAKEEIRSLKAYSYNLVDGKIERDKLKGSEFFEKRLNDYWIEVSFAIPGILDGTVIEYSYTKESDYLNNLSKWHFQSDIPTARSEFRTTIPDYFNYQISQVGNVYETDYEEGNKRESFTIRWEADIDDNIMSGGSRQRSSSIVTQSKTRRFVVENVPPVETEPFMNNKADVPSRVEFQLISTKFPNGKINYVAGSYEKFNNELLDRSSFGKRLENGNFIKSYLESNSFTSEQQKASKIYHHIANKIAWNDVYSLSSSEAGKSTYKEEVGSVAAINLTLIAALREAGINSYPVILSTRGHGTIHPIYPSYEDFNYVIAAVEIEGSVYLCDGSSKLPFGMIPLKCRNGQGWLVKESGGSWVNMKTSSEYKKSTMLITKLEGDSLITDVALRETGYAAYNTMKNIKANSESEFIKEFKNNYTDAKVSQMKLSEINLSEPMNIKYTVSKELNGANIIYIQPVSEGSIMQNPFSRETRVSPIDFAFQQSYRVVAQINIPEGYTAELPEPTMVRLPDNKGSFVYNVNQNGSIINVVSQLKLSTTDFSVQEYSFLKKFYQMVADKNQEMIVLSQ